MNKRILAWLLTLCMVLSIVPFTPLTAKVEAAEEITYLETEPLVKWGDDIDSLTNGPDTLAVAAAAKPNYIQFVQGGTFTSENKIYDPAAGSTVTIDLNGCHMYSSGTPARPFLIYATAGDVIFTDNHTDPEEWGSVTVAGGSHGPIMTIKANTGDLIFNGGVYTGVYGAFKQYCDGNTGSVILNAGTFVATQTNQTKDGGAIDVASGDLIIGDVTITSSMAQDIFLRNRGAGYSDMVNLTNYPQLDGLRIKAAADLPVANVILPQGYDVFDANGDLVTTLVSGTVYTLQKIEAKWGESENALTNAGTYAEALEAANGSTTGGDPLTTYVQLQSDVYLADGKNEIRNYTGGTITFDFNGHTITGSVIPFDIRGTKGGKVILTDTADGTGGVTSTGGNGALYVRANSTISIDIEGGTYEGNLGVYVPSTYTGTLTINDGTFTSTSANAIRISDGTYIINGGTFVSEDAEINIYTANTVLNLSEYNGTPALNGLRVSAGKNATGPVANITLPEGYALYNGDEAVTEGNLTASTTYTVKLVQGEDPEEPTCTLTYVEAKAATCTEAGNIGYWYCADETCENYGKYYSDAEGKEEIEASFVVIEPDENAHDYRTTYTDNEDGTHTEKQICRYNADHVVTGATEDHEFVDGVCVDCKVELQVKWGASLEMLNAGGTLTDAVSAAGATLDTTYIQFQKGITLDAAVTLRANITFDLNGKTITGPEGSRPFQLRAVTSPVYEGQTFTVTFKDSQTGGKVYAPGGVAIFVYANSQGNLVIENGTFESAAANVIDARGAGSITVNGGTFITDGAHSAIYVYNPDATLTVQNAAFGDSNAADIQLSAVASAILSGNGMTVRGNVDLSRAAITLPEGYEFYAPSHAKVAADGVVSTAIYTISDKPICGLEFVDTVAATCENVGYNAHYACTTCSRVYLDEEAAEQTSLKALEIEALGHDYTAICTDNEDGATHTAVYTCKNDPAHTYTVEDEPHVFVDGTCVCNAVNQHMHNFVKVEAKEATCTEEGNIEYYYCDAAGCPLDGQKYSDEGITPIEGDVTLPVNPNAHEYDENGVCVCGKTAVAQIGDKYYGSFAEAFAQGGEIELLSDVEVDESLIVDAEKEVTLNLGNYTLTPNGGIGNFGALTIIGGTIASADEGVFTIENGATMTINGTTVNGSLATSGVFTINSGSVEYLWAMTPAEGVASTTIVDGSFVDIKLSVNNSIICPAQDHEAIGDLLSFDTGYVGKWVEAENKFIATELTVDNTEAEINGTYYPTIQDAINDAQGGDTITLTNDASITELEIENNVTLDLNGNDLTLDALLMFGGQIVDNSADKSGVLKVAKDALVVPENNSQVPVWTGEGYVFATMKNQVKYAKIEDNGDTFAISLKPSFGQVFNETYLKDGSEAADAKVTVKISWGVGENSQIFEFNDELTAKVYGQRLAFKLTVRGLTGYENLRAEVIVEGSGASYLVTDYNLSDMIAEAKQAEANQ
ncbi:MAG: hypothetical protein IKB87_04450 [Clostridia bacterium]|nr:hypothetical protein [Clostridia bacterium]